MLLSYEVTECKIEEVVSNKTSSEYAVFRYQNKYMTQGKHTVVYKNREQSTVSKLRDRSRLTKNVVIAIHKQAESVSSPYVLVCVYKCR